MMLSCCVCRNNNSSNDTETKTAYRPRAPASADRSQEVSADAAQAVQVGHSACPAPEVQEESERCERRVECCLGADATPRVTRHCGSLDAGEQQQRPQRRARDCKAAHGADRRQHTALLAPSAPKGAEELKRYNGFCAIDCISDRPQAVNGGHIPRDALSGDKSLRAKELEISALEKKVEALMQTRAQLAARFQKTNGEDAAVSLPRALEAEVSRTGALCMQDWVDRISRYESAMSGVHARTVNEACAHVLGSTNRLIELHEMEESYAEILMEVDNLAQQRISNVNSELEKLDAEVIDIEDLIYECYDKMVDEDGQKITRDRFVMVICEEGDVNRGFVVLPKDAEHLFDQMSKGQTEMTFEQFKEELPHGCLQVLRGNIELRRSQAKRYRDYWF